MNTFFDDQLIFDTEKLENAMKEIFDEKLQKEQYDKMASLQATKDMNDDIS